MDLPMKSPGNAGGCVFSDFDSKHRFKVSVADLLNKFGIVIHLMETFLKSTTFLDRDTPTRRLPKSLHSNIGIATKTPNIACKINFCSFVIESHWPLAARWSRRLMDSTM